MPTFDDWERLIGRRPVEVARVVGHVELAMERRPPGSLTVADGEAATGHLLEQLPLRGRTHLGKGQVWPDALETIAGDAHRSGWECASAVGHAEGDRLARTVADARDRLKEREDARRAKEEEERKRKEAEAAAAKAAAEAAAAEGQPAK